ncbi:MAG: hypothetical protein VX278_19670, partial [Myxococcota bacterium]|nr:hypothetical protein [Myxococcota bacterium]
GEECAITLGKNIGSRFVLTGDLARLDGFFILNVSVYDTKNGNVLGTRMEKADSLLGLLPKVRPFVRQFLTDVLGKFEKLKSDRIGERRTFTVQQSKRILYVDAEEEAYISVSVDGKRRCDTIPCSFIVEQGTRKVKMRGKDCTDVDKKLNIESNFHLSTVQRDPNDIEMNCGYGFLDVESESAGQVSIKNDTYNAPFTGIKVPTGTHELTFESRCFQDAKRTVSIDSLQRTRYTMKNLRAKQVRLDIAAFKQDGSAVKKPIITVDGQPRPLKNNSIQIPYCSQMLQVKADGITVEHKLQLYEPGVGAREKKLRHKKEVLTPEKSYRLEIPMEHFDREDFLKAQSAFRTSNAIDISLFTLSGASAIFAGYELSQSQQFYAQASAITNPESRTEYDEQIAQGDSAMNLFVGGTAVATGALTAAIINTFVFTRSKRSEYEYIKLVTE